MGWYNGLKEWVLKLYKFRLGRPAMAGWPLFRRVCVGEIAQGWGNQESGGRRIQIGKSLAG